MTSSDPLLSFLFLLFLCLPSLIPAEPFSSSSPFYFDPSGCSSRVCIYVSPWGVDTWNGTSMSYPVRTIQQAFTVIVNGQNTINNHWTAPLIVVDAGVYPGSVIWRGVDVSLTSVYGASLSIIRCTGSTTGISIVNNESNNTVISGITVTDCQAFMGAGITIRGMDTAPILKDIIITNNTAGVGGGVSVSSGHPEFHRVVIANNSAPEGGGMTISTNLIPVILRNCIIRDNTAKNAAAGGMSIRNAYVEIYNTTIQRNMAHQAGGIFTDSSRIRIYNSIFADNQAVVDEGGGIWSVRSLIEIYDTLFYNNRAFWNGGGIIFRLPRTWPDLPVDSMAMKYALQMYRCTFAENYAGASGGAISIKEDHKLYAQDCIFRNNRGGDGGAIYFTTDSDGLIVRGQFYNNIAWLYGAALQWKNSNGICLDCIFEQNLVIPKPVPGGVWGGAIYISNSGVTFTRGRVSNNVADLGGGFAIVSKGSLTMTGTQIYNNTGNVSGGGIYLQQATLKLNGAIIYNNTAVNGGGLYVEKPSSFSFSNNTFTSNRATQAGGAIYFADGTSTSYDWTKNNFSKNTANYGQNTATTQIGLSWIQQPTAMPRTSTGSHDVDPNTNNTIQPKTIPTSLPSFKPIARSTVQQVTIDNMQELLLDIALVDGYGQQVNNSAAANLELLTAVTLVRYNQTNETLTAPVLKPMEGSITKWSRYRLISGHVFGVIVLAGTPGSTYEIGFTTTNTAILGIRLLVTIRACQALDTITYYPPGSHDYELCDPSPVQYISSRVFHSVLSLGVILSTGLLAILAFTLYHWNHAVIKSSTPLFLVILIGGALMSYVAIILMNVDINRLSSSSSYVMDSRSPLLYDGISSLQNLCRAQYWLLSFGCVLMFGTLALKTHRISLIFCNSHLQVIHQNSTLRMCQILIAGIIIEIIIDGIWLGIDPLTVSYSFSSNVANSGYITTSCSSQSLVMPIISTLYKAFIVLACVWYAFKTRHVVSMFNESRQLMTAAYNMAMCVLVTLILVVVLPDKIARNVAFSYGALFVITSTWMIILLPKLYLVITGVTPTLGSHTHTHTHPTITTATGTSHPHPHPHPKLKEGSISKPKHRSASMPNSMHPPPPPAPAPTNCKRPSQSQDMKAIPINDIHLDPLSPTNTSSSDRDTNLTTNPVAPTLGLSLGVIDGDVPLYEGRHPRSSMSSIPPSQTRARAKNSI